MAFRKVARPKRQYGALLKSLQRAWKISDVASDIAISVFGKAKLSYFDPANIRVAVWNMCKGAGGVLFNHDYRVLCYTSDLVLTQEALLSEKGMRTFCEPGFQLIHAASYQRRDGVLDGVMTVSRVQASEKSIRVLCKYPEPIFKTPKAGLISFYPLSSSPVSLMVVNLHATLVRSKNGAVDEMLHFLTHLPNHRGPAILAGDFNVFTDGYLKAIGKVLLGLGLVHVKIQDDPRPSLGQLDHVFVRGLRVETVTVDTTFKSSDHFPLCLRLSANFQEMETS